MFKAVIFDFDGTLVDSEWAYALTDIEFIKELGGDYFDVDHSDNIGMGVAAILESYMKAFSIKNRSLDELIELNDKIFLDIASDEIECFPKMMKLIKALYHKDIPMAVATGSTPMIVDVISKQTGIDSYINKLYSSRDVENEKPQPDIFLHAAEQLGVKPEDCLVFEDSQTGVTAALRAGMSVVWLDNLSNKNSVLQEQTFRYYPNGHSDLNYRDILELV